MDWSKLAQRILPKSKFFVEPTPAPTPTPTRAWSRGQEVAWQNSYMFGGTIAPYNPDELVSKKGLLTYEKMAHDEQLKAASSIIEMATLSPGFDVLPPELPEDADEGRKQEGETHARFIKFVLNEMAGSYDDRLGDVLTARVYGYSVSELIFNPVGYGEFAGLITVSDLKTRHPWGLDFQCDEFGNLKAVLQANRPLPIGKFMIYTHRKRLGNFYGQSEFRAAYRPWFIKDAVIKFMTIALERCAVPIPKFSSEAGQTLTDSQRISMESFIANLQVKTGIILPPGVQLAFEHPDARTDNIFIPCLRYLDDCLRLSQLCPALIGMSAEQAVGSLARSGTEFETFLWVIQKLRLDLQVLHDEQLIKPLIDLNYDVSDGLYPRFKFNAMTEAIKERIYKNWLAGVQGKSLTHTLKDENKARELIGFEPIDEEEYAAERQRAADATRGLFKKKYAVKERADFQAIKDALDNDVTPYAERMLDLLGRYQREVIRWAGDKLRNLRPEDAATFGVSSGDELTETVGDLLNYFWQRGRAIGRGELPKGTREFTNDRAVIHRPLNIPYAYAPELREQAAKKYQIGIPPEEAMRAMAARSWLIKGVIDQDIQRQARFELIRHLEQGRTINETIGRLRAIFEPWIGDPTKITPTGQRGPEWPVEKSPENILAAFRLENIIRTESGWALNQGRVAQGEAAGEFVVGYELTAILDERTTPEICARADGLRFSKNHAQAAKLIPPLHYSCRSTIIYLTKDDEPLEWSTDAEIDSIIRAIPAEFK